MNMWLAVDRKGEVATTVDIEKATELKLGSSGYSKPGAQTHFDVQMLVTDGYVRAPKRE